MSRQFFRTPIAIAVTAIAIPMTPQAFAENGLVLEEVTVTAQRRSQNIQDVPLAVSAISGEELSNRGLSSLDELAQSVPSVTLEASRATNTTLTAFIRGVG